MKSSLFILCETKRNEAKLSEIMPFDFIWSRFLLLNRPWNKKNIADNIRQRIKVIFRRVLRDRYERNQNDLRNRLDSFFFPRCSASPVLISECRRLTSGASRRSLDATQEMPAATRTEMSPIQSPAAAVHFFDVIKFRRRRRRRQRRRRRRPVRTALSRRRIRCPSTWVVPAFRARWFP